MDTLSTATLQEIRAVELARAMNWYPDKTGVAIIEMLRTYPNSAPVKDLMNAANYVLERENAVRVESVAGMNKWVNTEEAREIKLRNAVLKQLNEKGFVYAVKEHWMKTNSGLKEAKDYVDALKAEQEVG